MYSDEYNRLFKAAYGEIERHLREKGWLDKAYWYWIDEPHTDSYPWVRQGLELLKWACPDIRRLLTLLCDPAPVPYLYGAVDLWVPSTHTETDDIPDGAMMGYDPERAHARQALGETVWWYTCNIPMGPYTNFFIDNPAINYRIHFWLMDKYEVDGFLYWATMSWPRNPWENPMGTDYPQTAVYGNGAGWFLYPARRTLPPEHAFELPITSIRFESLRDGIEDREYLLLLKTIAETQGRSADRAREVRSAALDEVAQSMTCYEQAPVSLIAQRYRLAKQIEKGL